MNKTFSTIPTSLMDSKNNDKHDYEVLKWQFAVENSRIGVWDWNALTNSVFYSKESKIILGYLDDEIDATSEAWDSHVYEKDKAQYFKDFQDHVEGKVAHYKNEHRVICKDGTYKWVLDKGKVIERDKDGKPLRIIGTHTDITERKHREEKLVNNIDIITSQKNKLQNFAHIVTHNLKQHAGNFESLLGFYDDAASGEEKNELINYLKTLSSSLTNTISNLSQIVSIQHNKYAKIETLFLKKEIDSIVNMLDVIVKESTAEIVNNVCPELNISYNPAYLESIIQNLLTNAIKYKHPERSPKITIDSFRNEELVLIKVSDNGIGIDLEKYGDSVFDLYKTFHQNEDSEGVGLYLIKNQIEAFGGKISIKSEVNIGTTFTITLPNKN